MLALFSTTSDLTFRRTHLGGFGLVGTITSTKPYSSHWFEPGEEIPVRTKSARERRYLGRWMAALNAAKHSDFSKMDKFPRNTKIGGVTLPTSRKEVQRILEALAEKESPYEGLYRTLARPA